ncbi:MAG: DUF2270 domain-containing protein [Anaerolineales bacterium]|nr:DUF2270 domain-containing protein [Anaerolineales bacterium]
MSQPETPSGGEHGAPDLQALWQFAGQGLRSGDFNTAMVHFYRGELGRSNAWRARLDATTNWAVISTGAALTFAFGAPGNTPIVLIINTILVLLFLYIEARRYRYYELWTYRVRILEQNYLGGLLSPPFLPRAGWADRLTESLNHPRFPISLLEAFGRRYRRNYAPLFLVLALAWLAKIVIHPDNLQTTAEFWQRAAVGPVPGWLVLATGILFHAILMGLGLFSVGLQESTGEVLSDERLLTRLRHRLRLLTWDMLEIELPRPSAFDTRGQLVYIVSDEVEAIGTALLSELKRGVTLLHGTGMYTGREHGVLMCAVQVKQISYLKQAVKQIDPRAFIIITPVSDVLGGGFQPLET